MILKYERRFCINNPEKERLKQFQNLFAHQSTLILPSKKGNTNPYT